MDFGAELYVEQKYGLNHGDQADPAVAHRGSVDAAMLQYEMGRRRSTVTGHDHQPLHSGDQDEEHFRERDFAAQNNGSKSIEDGSSSRDGKKIESVSLNEKQQDAIADRGFKQQIAAFLILEFGVIFHS